MRIKCNENKNMYIISIISKIIYVGLSLVNSVIINRYLGPILKGEYSLIFNVVNILTVIIGFNIASSYPYFSKKYGGEIKQKFINIIFYQAIIYFFMTAILCIVVNEKLVIGILLISIVLQFNNQVTFMAIVIDINKRNIINIIASSIYTLLLFIVFITTKNNIFYIISAQIIFAIINSLLIIINNNLYPKIKFENISSLKEICKFSFFPMITTLLTTLNYNLDIIIMNMFVTNSEIGLYSLGVTLAAMLWILPDAFKDVLFNKTAKNDSIRDIILSIKFNVYMSIFIIIGFVLFGKVFIRIAYGEAFVKSYYVSIVLFIGTIPMIFFKMINTLYLAIGKQMYSFYILLIAVIINIISNFIFIPLFGINGAAISSVLSYMICGVIILRSFKNTYDIKFSQIFFVNENEKKIISSSLNNILRKISKSNKI